MLTDCRKIDGLFLALVESREPPYTLQGCCEAVTALGGVYKALGMLGLPG